MFTLDMKLLQTVEEPRSLAKSSLTYANGPKEKQQIHRFSPLTSKIRLVRRALFNPCQSVPRMLPK